MKTADHRIARGTVIRDTTIHFTFDGKRYAGQEGDTLASALLANGVHLVGRSFKYHRPRGVLGAGADEPNALVGVRRDRARYTPNLLATQVELYDGLDAVSQNRHPSLENDRMAVNDKLLSRFIPAGFYYKTFMWPKKAWDRLYEPRIREAAGLGVAPSDPDPDHYTQRYVHCDVLVIGGGPAGIVAAREAAETGARVILCDDRARLGGSLLAAVDTVIAGHPAADWLDDALAALAALPNVTLLPRTIAFGYYPHNWIGLTEKLTDHLASPAQGRPRERLWQVRAAQVVLATGAIERPLVFPDNDRPGIMLADAARTYLQQYGVAVGRTIVIVGAHDNAYRVAQEMAAAGVTIAAVADIRPRSAVSEAARLAGLPVVTDAKIDGTTGGLRVASITITGDGATRRYPCNAVLMAGGFTPSVHLFSQSRGKLAWDEGLQAYLPSVSAEAERSAGACRGRFALAEAIADGIDAGRDAASAAGFAPSAPASVPAVFVRHLQGVGGYMGAAPTTSDLTKAKAFVDWQNDVTAKDIMLATREGFLSIEHVKRYTTTGMATDQGKLSNINALGIVSEATGRSIPEIGLTTFRSPYTPVTFGTLAGHARGDLFDPARITAINDWAKAHGAAFEDVGNWRRAHYFPRAGEDMHAAVNRECVAVRQGVGIFDASTLGKIEVVGPDAAEFMNRFFVNAWTKLGVGKCRYGVLLREDGFVMDDGVVGRLAADRFHVTTTTGGAARVLNMMEDYLQTEWPDLNVWLTSTTEQWSVIAVQGPRAREVIAPLIEGLDVSAEAFPHMSIADARICGVPMRLMRVSFTGELGFEVNVPSGYGRMVWEAIWERGKPFDMVPYGTETMHVLRAEKGYIIVGQETDGTVTPDDVGLSWAIGKAKPDFVGKRSLARPAMSAPDRKQLVGLRTVDGRTVLEEGAQIVTPAAATTPIGHVTSAYYSEAVNAPIALALVRGGRARLGEMLHVPMPAGPIAVQVVSPIFYDPEGTRIDV
ncbi:sarcosine oxidase subunit alpha family protein [Sphingomonas sp. S6]|jgi:sarcosine oxidase subunit alpha|uniref:sarcosine oxidase subunit alpha family protein n=1 Tax=Sphingomonas sp. S6 TaxID=3368600 RepID=UPI0028F15229|nr:sarcosine oxidase subunit alpha family protein [uncultured Sphingomonas sp.]